MVQLIYLMQQSLSGFAIVSKAITPGTGVGCRTLYPDGRHVALV